jgi:hypothetical protein
LTLTGFESSELAGAIFGRDSEGVEQREISFDVVAPGRAINATGEQKPTFALAKADAAGDVRKIQDQRAA